MTLALSAKSKTLKSVEINVRGIVQGVGFRPFVWRLANQCKLGGEVRNDTSGVHILATGHSSDIEQFLQRLKSEVPLLSRIDKIECVFMENETLIDGFRISESCGGDVSAHVAADAAVCSSCAEEVLSPFERRFRYPFTNCTQCGPRFSIVKNIPYDRSNTTMASFDLCPECRSEYENPEDRRFHAQPVACHICGPKAKLVHLNKGIVTFDMHSMLDDVDAVCSLIQKGEIVAIRGIGGFHLTCDATNKDAVRKLRERKQRDLKPFALMARDLDIIRQYTHLSALEEDLLTSLEAPIVLLRKKTSSDFVPALACEVAPNLNIVGFMLPYTPLHLLVLRRMERPVVMTSANISDQPQIINNNDVIEKMVGVADYALCHDRDIANRVDDSVVRIIDGQPRMLRRARGYAPGAIELPEGFGNAPDLLAFGSELKSTFCLTHNGSAILSQHQGDLENVETFDDYENSLKLYQNLYEHTPELLAADLHPEYLSSKLALQRAEKDKLPIALIQHHHAHIASCLVENNISLDTDHVLGVALDGLGYGDDGEIWGGEFMLANYTSYRRSGTFKPVAMIGGEQAIKQPWRNIYAHLIAEMGWDRFSMNYNETQLFEFLSTKPLDTIDQMLKMGTNVPLASSCGRLFDAVAAAIGICSETAAYEGQGAMMLEAIVDETVITSQDEETAYPFSIPNLSSNNLPYIEPLAMWQALFGDLILKTPAPVMAARFHKGLARIIADMVFRLVRSADNDGCKISKVVLTGGCFQNSILFELVAARLNKAELEVLSHSKVPSNDGGIALGQAAIAAAKFIKSRS